MQLSKATHFRGIFYQHHHLFKLQSCSLVLKSQHAVDYDLSNASFDKKRPWNHFYVLPDLWDRTHWKIGENSRSICVEGNIAVGKAKFAKEIAAAFDLKFVDDVSDDDIYINRSLDPPIDYRLFNSMLPNNRLKFYTTDLLFTDKDPINKGKPLYLQYSYYMYRYVNWFKATGHLFNTGQGFVSKRSPFSDYIFARAMAECNMLSQDAESWYTYARRNSVRSVYEPHILIYLKSPVSLSRDNIKKRGRQWEMSGITDKFLQTIKEVYESDFLPKMRKYSDVIEVDLQDYDINDSEDVHVIAEHLATLDLSGKGFEALDQKFLKWRDAFGNHDTKDWARNNFSSADNSLKVFDRLPCPDWLLEAQWTLDELALLNVVLEKHPNFSNTEYNGYDTTNPNIVDAMLGKIWKDKVNFEKDVLKKFMFMRSNYVNNEFYNN